MTINLNGITLNAKTLDLLDNLAYVRPLLDADNKAFAVQTCKENDDRAMNLTGTDNLRSVGL